MRSRRRVAMGAVLRLSRRFPPNDPGRAAFHVGPVIVARSLLARTIGLIGRPRAAPMLFPRCHAIHTFLMRFPVDILCLDRNNRIIRSMPSVRPWRVILAGRRTASILELPGGYVRQRGLGVGDRIEYVEKSRR